MQNRQATKPIYAELIDVPSYCEQAESASEVHGILIGILCRNAFAPTGKWVQALELEGSVSDTRFQTVREQLDDVWNYSHQSLNQIETEFEPLLPSDDESLSERSAELGAWSQGFLYGFSLQEAVVEGMSAEGEEENEEESEEEISQIVTEILQDVVEISQVASHIDGDDVESIESNEAAFIELVEYLRVSIQLVFEEMAGQKIAGRKDPIYVDPRYIQDYADDESIH